MQPKKGSQHLKIITFCPECGAINARIFRQPFVIVCGCGHRYAIDMGYKLIDPKVVVEKMVVFRN